MNKIRKQIKELKEEKSIARTNLNRCLNFGADYSAGYWASVSNAIDLKLQKLSLFLCISINQ